MNISILLPNGNVTTIQLPPRDKQEGAGDSNELVVELIAAVGIDL